MMFVNSPKKNLMFAKNSRLPFFSRTAHKCQRCLAILLIMLLSWSVVPLVHGDVIFTNLISFDGTNGANPRATLVQGTDGNFYGTTYNGGTNGNYGTVFQMTTNGVFTPLVSFSGTNGANPSAALVQGPDGNFYGTTYNGGTNGDYGTVFQVTTNGVLTSLVSFNNINGANPQGALALGPDGNFYGTTYNGGSNGMGTVFQVTTNGLLTTLVSFNNTNGANPQGTLLLGGDGNFYGTTSSGGTNSGNGTVFQITSSGALTSLYSFNDTDGALPYAGLTIGPNGIFYGTTLGGGTNNSVNGTLFQITTNGVLSSLVFFDSTNGATPYDAPIRGADGNYYGTTTSGGGSKNFGTIFEMTPNGTLATLYSFSGSFPYAGLIQGRDGNFYGTTYGDGAYSSGTIFRITITPTQPVIQPITRNGRTINITWNAMLGKQYQVQYTTNLSPANWQNLGDPITATNVTATASDIIGPDPNRFYRVVLLLTPAPAVIESLVRSGDTASITWSAIPGKQYQVKYATSLNPSNWKNLGCPTTAINTTATISDHIGNDPQRFYRVAMKL